MRRKSDLELWADRLGRFQAEAARHLAHVESSVSRKITLDESYDTLTGLSLKQDDLFRQALRCVEVGVFRAAHVMCWSATMDFLHTVCASDCFAQLSAARPKWSVGAVAELRENYTDHAVLEAMKVAAYIERSEEKGFKGMLSRRNECAHPSDFLPGMNESLGYLSEAFKRVAGVQRRYPGLR